MAAAMLPGVMTTLLRPRAGLVAARDAPKTLREAVVQPFTRVFFPPGCGVDSAVRVLLYKVGEMMASADDHAVLSGPGVSAKTEIGTVVKLFGFWATVDWRGARWRAHPADGACTSSLWTLRGILQAMVPDSGLRSFWPRLGHSVPGAGAG
jgi:PAT family beta-lactamase induction signal transducer AmpG